MKHLLMVGVLALLFTGCTGVITGHEYSKKDFVIMYKVVKSGVSTFMTTEDIEKAKLDKIDIVVTDTYKLVNPNEGLNVEPKSETK